MRPPCLSITLLVVDSLPRWLGPATLYLALVLLLAGTITRVFPELTRDVSNESPAGLPLWFRYLAVTGFVIGGIFAATGALRLHGLFWLFVVGLLALGRALEAAAQVGFFIRLYLVVTDGRWSSNTRAKLPKFLASLFLTLMAVTVAVHIATTGPVTDHRLWELQIVWTGFTFGSAALGFAWKLRHLTARVRTPLVVGMILLFSSVEIYNLTLLQDFVAVLITGVAGTLGFWFAAIIAWRQIHTSTKSSSST